MPNNDKIEQELALARRRVAELENQMRGRGGDDGFEDRSTTKMAEFAPIPMWEVDASRVKLFLDALVEDGVEDLAEYLLENEEVMTRAMSLGRTTYVNRLIRHAMGASTLDQFVQQFHRSLTPSGRRSLAKAMARLHAGRTGGYQESVHIAPDGQLRDIAVYWTLYPDTVDTWERSLVTFVDITAQKAAERALQENEQRYRALFERNPSVMWLVDSESGLFFDVNQAACDFYGYDRQRFMQMKISDINVLGHVNVLPHLHRAATEAIRLEFTHRRADGECCEVEVYAGPFTLGEKKLVLSTIHDITERKRASEAMRRAEEKYRSLYENSAQGIIQINADGTITSMNPAMAAILGYDNPDEAMEAAPNVAAIYADRLQREHVLTALDNLGSLHNVPIEIKRRDGSRGWINLSARGVRGPEGELVSSESFINDITSQRLAELALAQSEKRYRAIVDNSLAAIYIFQDDRYVFVNKAMLDMIGVDSPDEVLGKYFWTFIHPIDRPVVVARAQQRAKGHDVPSHYPFRCLRKDGTLCWVDMQATLIQYRGRPAVLGNLIDITDRQMASERLAQAQKMEAVGTLAGGIAHDFNNILQSIRGSAQIVAAHTEDKAQQGRLAEIDEAVDRAAELIQRLLIFSRGVKPSLIKLDLNKEVSQVVRILERTIPKWIAIDTDLQDDLPLVSGDPIGLAQSMMNLATNAREAMAEGGRLSLQTRTVALDEKFCFQHPELTPGTYVRLSVADTGPGIDESVIKQIFDPFFSTKEVGAGSGLGLGLAQVYGTVKSHSGHIEVESRLGRGTRFKVYLPCGPVEPDQPELMDRDVQPVPGNDAVVLLVDDEDAILDVSGQALEENGYRALRVKSGEEALSLLETGQRVDVAVLDLGMPGMGGRVCLSKLRHSWPWLKVIVATGYADEENRAWALNQGASAFLAKPYRLSALMSAIERTIDSN